jgi:MFS transporter, Spinster family, sphingosine-1-phosphate transporter
VITAETHSGRRKWKVLALLVAAGALNYADRTAITSVFPLLRRDLAISDVGLAAIGSLFLWSYAFTSPVAGIVADRVSRSRLIAISLAAWSIVTAATGLVTNSGQLFGLRILLGVSECVYLPAALGLLADYHGPNTRATALGIHSGALTAGMIAGGTAAGFLADRVGWRPSFLILGAIGVVLAAAAGIWLRDPTAPGRETVSNEPFRATVSALAGTPSYAIILAEAGLIALSTWVFINWLPLYFRETYQLTLAAAGFSGTFALTAGATAGVLAGGYLSDRVARGDARRRLLILGVLYALSAPLLLVFLLRPAVGILGFAILMHGFLRALGSANELPLLCELLPPRRRGAAMGFLNAMNTFIGGSGVFVSGLLMSHSGLTQIFIGLAGVVLLASAVALIGYRWVLPKDLARKQRSCHA